MNAITFKQATNGKTYKHSFTDRDGAIHNLTAFCDTDDESVMDWSATWTVMDDARSDGEVRTFGQAEEAEMLTELAKLANLIRADFHGINLGFDFADQCFKQF